MLRRSALSGSSCPSLIEIVYLPCVWSQNHRNRSFCSLAKRKLENASSKQNTLRIYCENCIHNNGSSTENGPWLPHARAQTRICLLVCLCSSARVSVWVCTYIAKERERIVSLRKKIVHRYAFVCVLRNYLSIYTYLPTFFFVILYQRIVGLYPMLNGRENCTYDSPSAPHRRLYFIPRRNSIFIGGEKSQRTKGLIWIGLWELTRFNDHVTVGKQLSSL